MEHRPIAASNCIAVEAVYMVEALTIVKSMKMMQKPEIVQRVQDKYRDRSFKVTMEAKHFRAKGMSADGLLTKANDVLKNVR